MDCGPKIVNGPTPIMDIELERHRSARELAQLNYRMEAVRMAQQVALENARNRPAGERHVTVEEIEALAQKFIVIVGV